MAEDPKLIRKAQVLGKVETTAGTAEALTAADGKCRILEGGGFEPDLPVEARGIARSSLTNLGSLPGMKAGTVNFRTEVNTPDSITGSDLEFKQFLQGSSLTVVNANGVDTDGVVAGGPFVRGETVTGGTSSATGRLLKAFANGDDIMYVEPISGTFSSGETLTGGTSGATVDTDAVAVHSGYVVKPVSVNQDTLTVEYQEDGYAWSVKGAMSNIVGTFEASRPGYFDFNFTGPKSTFGDKALTTGITRDSEEPPIMQCSEMTIDSTTLVFHSATFDMGNNVVHRIDANACDTGIIAYWISSREPKLTVSFEHVPASVFDTFAKLDSASKVPVYFRVGTTAGKTFMFFADLAQVVNIAPGDADGIRTLDVEMMLTGAAGSSDDEFEMVFI